MSLESPNPQNPTQPGETASRRTWRDQTCRAFDMVLAGLWLALAGFGVWAVAGELYFQLGSPSWTSMWESGPLQVALDAFHGQGTYRDWNSGPVHLAIYGPLYHGLLAWLAWAAQGVPDTLTAAARWLSVLSLFVATLGVIRYVRLAGGPAVAALIAPVCLLLLTRLELRFLASARPDGLAVMFSVLAMVAAFGNTRASAALTVALLTAAWQTKMTSIAALLTVIIVLAYAGRYARAAWILGGTMILNAGILALLASATDGWALRHLLAPSAAPNKLEYLWLMLTNQRSSELPLLVAMPLLALLVSFRPGLPALDDGMTNDGATGGLPASADTGGQAASGTIGATVYWLVSWMVALAAGLHQGSNRNYLIEPTLATGMVLGIFAARVMRTLKTQGRPALGFKSRSLWLTRAVILGVIACCVVLLVPYRTARFDEKAHDAAAGQNMYTPAALDWARTLPQPLLSLDSWLTYRAGVPNDLNDSVAYVGLLHKARRDVIAERAAAGEYRAIVLPENFNQPGGLLGDIPRIWPALRQAIESRYAPVDKSGIWVLFAPKPLTPRGSSAVPPTTR